MVTARLFTSLIGGPMIALVAQLIVYAMMQWTCSSGNRQLLHWPLFIPAVACVALALSSFHVWRERRSDPPSESDVVGRRDEFLAIIGFLACVLSFTAIVAMWLALPALHPCQTT